MVNHVLKRLMEEKGITQNELAEKTELSQTIISIYCKDTVGLYKRSISSVLKIANALDVEPEVFFEVKLKKDYEKSFSKWLKTKQHQQYEKISVRNRFWRWKDRKKISDDAYKELKAILKKFYGERTSITHSEYVNMMKEVWTIYYHELENNKMIYFAKKFQFIYDMKNEDIAEITGSKLYYINRYLSLKYNILSMEAQIYYKLCLLFSVKILDSIEIKEYEIVKIHL